MRIINATDGISINTVYSLDVLIQARGCIADFHRSTVPLLCAAEQREGVVPSPQTCKQIIFASATTEC